MEEQQPNYVEYGSGSYNTDSGIENYPPQNQDPMLIIEGLQQQLKIQEYTNYYLVNKIERLEQFCYGVLSKRLDQQLANMSILFDKNNEKQNEVKKTRDNQKRR
jgi:hypothetical protein